MASPGGTAVLAAGAGARTGAGAGVCAEGGRCAGFLSACAGAWPPNLEGSAAVMTGPCRLGSVACWAQSVGLGGACLGWCGGNTPVASLPAGAVAGACDAACGPGAGLAWAPDGMVVAVLKARGNGRGEAGRSGMVGASATRSSSKVGMRRLRRSSDSSFCNKSGVSLGAASSGFFGSSLTASMRRRFAALIKKTYVFVQCRQTCFSCHLGRAAKKPPP